MIDLQSMVKVDLIVRKDTPYQKQAFERRKSFEIGQMPIAVITPEDLILSKLDWAKDSKSEMQFRDIKTIHQSVKNLDGDYLKVWTAKLGLSQLYEEALR